MLNTSTINQLQTIFNEPQSNATNTHELQTIFNKPQSNIIDMHKFKKNFRHLKLATKHLQHQTKYNNDYKLRRGDHIARHVLKNINTNNTMKLSYLSIYLPLSMSISGLLLKIMGDYIFAPTCAKHHGIYVDDDTVIHFTGTNKRNAEIIITTLKEFVNSSKTLFVYEHNKTETEINDIIIKAKSMLGKEKIIICEAIIVNILL